MRAFMKRVDLFCYRHPRFGINNLMLIIVIATGAVWLLGMMDTSGQLLSFLAFNPYLILRGQVWRLVTFIIYPTSGGISLLLFLYFYYFIGSTLEGVWGRGRFTIYYLMGALLTVVYGFALYFIIGLPLPVFSNYINLSMFFAFATLFPEQRVLLFYFIPIKIKWLALLDAAYFAYSIVDGLTGGLGAYSFLPLVAIVNYFLFCGGDLIRLLRPSGTREQRRSTINFKREARKINREQRAKGYTRKCAVCGRTDTDYPELEFRYCSRCKGVHCFCEDHINNHVHFTE